MAVIFRPSADTALKTGLIWTQIKFKALSHKEEIICEHRPEMSPSSQVQRPFKMD